MTGFQAFRFLNRSEDRTYVALTDIASQLGFSVFPKVRFIDTFDRESVSLDRSQISFALRAHVDFLLVNADRNPVMAIEFDGPGHLSPKQLARDETKDRICSQAGLPLIRAKSSYLTRQYGGMTALRWLVETTELAAVFDEAERAGEIAPDDGFDPMMVASVGSLSNFPYWLSAKSQAYLNRLWTNGDIRGTAGFVGRSQDGVTHRAIEVAELNDGTWIIQTGSMREQQLPWHYTQLIEMACTCELATKVKDVIASGRSGSPPEHAIEFLKPKFEGQSIGSGGGLQPIADQLGQLFGRSDWTKRTVLGL